jgi:hypothetical protein
VQVKSPYTLSRNSKPVFEAIRKGMAGSPRFKVGDVSALEVFQHEVRVDISVDFGKGVQVGASSVRVITKAEIVTNGKRIALVELDDEISLTENGSNPFYPANQKLERMIDAAMMDPNARYGEYVAQAVLARFDALLSEL